jgi:thiamine pyrophosphokinase
MSSHHIVRDEQEPALIIHRLDSFPTEMLGQLLEWSPTVAVCGPALEEALKYEIKIDLAIIDISKMDETKTRLEDQMPVKLLGISRPDFLKSALQFLNKENHKAVNIITTNELKDEVLESTIEYYKLFDIVIFDNHQKYSLISKSELRKWRSGNQEVSIINVADTLNVRTEGFENDFIGEVEDQIDLKMGKEGQTSIISQNIPFIISEKL